MAIARAKSAAPGGILGASCAWMLLLGAALALSSALSLWLLTHIDPSEGVAGAVNVFQVGSGIPSSLHLPATPAAALGAALVRPREGGRPARVPSSKNDSGGGGVVAGAPPALEIGPSGGPGGGEMEASGVVGGGGGGRKRKSAQRQAGGDWTAAGAGRKEGDVGSGGAEESAATATAGSPPWSEPPLFAERLGPTVPFAGVLGGPGRPGGPGEDPLLPVDATALSPESSAGGVKARPVASGGSSLGKKGGGDAWNDAEAAALAEGASASDPEWAPQSLWQLLRERPYPVPARSGGPAASKSSSPWAADDSDLLDGAAGAGGEDPDMGINQIPVPAAAVDPRLVDPGRRAHQRGADVAIVVPSAPRTVANLRDNEHRHYWRTPETCRAYSYRTLLRSGLPGFQRGDPAPGDPEFAAFAVGECDADPLCAGFAFDRAEEAIFLLGHVSAKRCNFVPTVAGAPVPLVLAGTYLKSPPTTQALPQRHFFLEDPAAANGTSFGAAHPGIASVAGQRVLNASWWQLHQCSVAGHDELGRVDPTLGGVLTSKAQQLRHLRAACLSRPSCAGFTFPGGWLKTSVDPPSIICGLKGHEVVWSRLPLAPPEYVVGAVVSLLAQIDELSPECRLGDAWYPLLSSFANARQQDAAFLRGQSARWGQLTLEAIALADGRATAKNPVVAARIKKAEKNRAKGAAPAKRRSMRGGDATAVGEDEDEDEEGEGEDWAEADPIQGQVSAGTAAGLSEEDFMAPSVPNADIPTLLQDYPALKPDPNAMVNGGPLLLSEARSRWLQQKRQQTADGFTSQQQTAGMSEGGDRPGTPGAASSLIPGPRFHLYVADTSPTEIVQPDAASPAMPRSHLRRDWWYRSLAWLRERYGHSPCVTIAPGSAYVRLTEASPPARERGQPAWHADNKGKRLPRQNHKQTLDFVSAMRFAASRSPRAHVSVWEDDCVACPEALESVSWATLALSRLDPAWGGLKVGNGGSGHVFAADVVRDLIVYLQTRRGSDNVDVSMWRFLHSQGYSEYLSRRVMSAHRGLVSSLRVSQGNIWSPVLCGNDLDFYWGYYGNCAWGRAGVARRDPNSAAQMTVGGGALHMWDGGELSGRWGGGEGGGDGEPGRSLAQVRHSIAELREMGTSGRARQVFLNASVPAAAPGFDDRETSPASDVVGPVAYNFTFTWRCSMFSPAGPTDMDTRPANMKPA